MSYSHDLFFENSRSVEARLFRAIESLLPESVEKILAKKKVVIQNEEWDALRVIADQVSLPFTAIRGNKDYAEMYSENYKNGLNILKQLLDYGAMSFENYGYPTALKILVEKGLVEYVELCLGYGVKFTLSELYIVVKTVDVDIFRLAQKHGIYLGYEVRSSLEYFPKSLIEMLYEPPQKNTWGRVKSLDGYLEDKDIDLNARLCEKLEVLIYKKQNCCMDSKEQRKYSKEMNQLQKNYYYDRLGMMQDIIKIIANNEELLGKKKIEYWLEYIDDYEIELNDFFEPKKKEKKFTKERYQEIRERFIELFTEKYEKGHITKEQHSDFLNDVKTDEGVQLFIDFFDNAFGTK